MGGLKAAVLLVGLVASFTFESILSPELRGGKRAGKLRGFLWTEDAQGKFVMCAFELEEGWGTKRGQPIAGKGDRAMYFAQKRAQPMARHSRCSCHYHNHLTLLMDTNVDKALTVRETGQIKWQDDEKG